MADLGATDNNDAQSTPTVGDEPTTNNGNDSRPQKRKVPDDDDDDDDKPGRERRKIDIKFIQDKSRRHITFSKRKAGIMKKAYELSVLTGTQVLLLVVSETGLVYTFTTPKLQPLVTKPEGKNLIQACLNAPSPTSGEQNGLEGDAPPLGDSPEDPNTSQHQAPPPGQPGMPRNQPFPPQGYVSPQDQLAYQQYMQQQQAMGQNPYAVQQPRMPPQQH